MHLLPLCLFCFRLLSITSVSLNWHENDNSRALQLYRSLKWRSDGTIWTNGTTRHSGNQKKTICWSHSATSNNQTSQSGLRMDTRRWQEEGRTTEEDMARHTERTLGQTGCWLEWCERYCQRSCQMETTRRPMFCSEREELSLSLSKITEL